jgi:hypothetical protein
MAEIDGNMIIIGAITLVIVLVLAYALFHNYRKKKMLQSLKQSNLPPEEGKSFLVEGEASSPELKLPSTGEPCAFYAINIRSKKIETTRVMVAGQLKGFNTWLISGDFEVKAQDGKTFTVGISRYLDEVKSVASKLTMGKVQEHEGAFSSALGLVFGFHVNTSGSRTKIGGIERRTTKVSSVQCNIDSSTKYYTIGTDTPLEILELIAENEPLYGEPPEEGEEICVVEAYIPLGKTVYAAGTYIKKDGENMLVMGQDKKIGLHVSYKL